MNTLFTILRSIIYVPAFILLFGWLALEVRVFDHRFGLSLPLWTRVPGIILVIAGGVLGLLCVITFITRGKGTPAPFDPPKEFVAAGPYAYVRNPMYIGGFILLTGFGLYHYSGAILILTLLLLFLFHLLVIFYEEPTLEKQFGISYIEYKKRIHRWMPRFN